MTASKNTPAALFMLVLIVVLGIFLRFEASLKELWLDEIYSLVLLQPSTTALQIFSIAVDNNHYLNSLYLFYLGAHASPLALHLPALLFAILTLILAVWICHRRGLLEGLLGAVVFSFSFVLVLYGSEARGYSSLLFFSLLCFALF
ncbi:MAG: hypothetical protein J0M12_09680, partial [Deltaproteobacteria bacterium]|nr:hypothetical protein [Deltaproteobacteria bacterium]